MKNQLHQIHPVVVFLAFICLSILMRFLSFFPSVLNHDESTYIVISDTILAGNLYQVDFIDTKPMGIFAVLAFAQLVVGKSIIALRLFAAIVLACTAFFLYRAKLSFGGKKEGAFAAGFIYIFLNSFFTHYGLSPNTETYFNLFTATALWMFLQPNGKWKYFVAGVLLGLGFVIKYMALFDGMAFGVFLVWLAFVNKTNPVTAILNSLIMAVGAALPFLILMAGYYRVDHLDEFLFYSFTVSGRYPVDKSFWDYVVFVSDFFLRFLPVTIMFVFVLIKKSKRSQLKQLGIIWSLIVFIGILIPGKAFGHYFIQFMLPFSFLAGEYFNVPIQKLPAVLRWTRKPRPGWIVVALFVTLTIFFQFNDQYKEGDFPRKLASYLKSEMEPGQIFYTSNDHITYHLLNQLPPVRYVHPSLFWDPMHIRNLEIDVEKEMATLKSLSPQFLVLRRNLQDDRFGSMLKNYTLVKTFDDRTDVYKRID